MSQFLCPFTQEQFTADISKYLRVSEDDSRYFRVKAVEYPSGCDLLWGNLTLIRALCRDNKKFSEYPIAAYRYQMSLVRTPRGPTVTGDLAAAAWYLQAENKRRAGGRVSRAISLQTGKPVVLKRATSDLPSEWKVVQNIKAIKSVPYMAIPEQTACTGGLLVFPFAGVNLFCYMKTIVTDTLPIRDLATIFHNLTAALEFLGNPSNFKNNLSYIHIDIKAENICVDVREYRVVKATLIHLESLLPAGDWEVDWLAGEVVTPCSLATECISAHLDEGTVGSSANLYSAGVLLLRMLYPEPSKAWLHAEQQLWRDERYHVLLGWRMRGRVLLTKAFEEALKRHDMQEWADLATSLLDNNPANRPTAKDTKEVFGAMKKSKHIWKYPLPSVPIESFCP